MSNEPDPVRQLPAPEGLAHRVEELYTAHARLVRSVCRSLLRDRNEADDAVQQTFLSAQRALMNGSVPREPAAWLATIARNECLARVRERMREPLPVDEEPTAFGADAHSEAVSRYEAATLRDALADLPRAQREAILLRELRGLSYDEVGRTLSLTTGAVESLIFRARRTLQVRLREALPAFSPVAFFGRLLGSGGDVTVPAVAKVTAVGLGATLLAGGAALGPHAFALGHSATKTIHSKPPAHVQATPHTTASPPAHIWAPPAVPAAGAYTAQHATVAGGASSSDGAEPSSPDSSSRDTSPPDTSSSDTSPPETSSPESDNPTATVPTVPPPPPPPSGDDAADRPDPSGD